MSLAQFLSGVAKTAGGKYAEVGRMENGVRPFGAYAMLTENWEEWSASAGLRGIDKSDPAAQDAVAAHMAQKLFQRYGDWGLVAAAWFAGQDQTDVAARSGKGLFFFKNDATKDFLSQFKTNFEASEGAMLPKQAQVWANPQGAPRGWLSPIAGENKWSGGSWMPNRTTGKGAHAAIDVYAKRGTPIVAPVGGTVLSTKTGKKGGYTVLLRGDDGLVYYFAHMNEGAVVKAGQKIRPGAHLGFVGNSGSASGTSPHLHFSIKKGGMAVNPKTYLDGAKNAGNYFAPGGEEHTLEKPRSTSEKMDGLLASVANQVAGGSRVDYRTIGTPEEEPNEELTEKLERQGPR